MDILNAVINVSMVIMSISAVIAILGSLVKLIINQF